MYFRLYLSNPDLEIYMIMDKNIHNGRLTRVARCFTNLQYLYIFYRHLIQLDFEVYLYKCLSFL